MHTTCHCKAGPGAIRLVHMLNSSQNSQAMQPLHGSAVSASCQPGSRRHACCRVVITDTVAMVLFTVDIWTRFNAGVVISNNLSKAIVMDRLLVSQHYVLRGPFIFDILSTVPLWIQVRET